MRRTAVGANAEKCYDNLLLGVRIIKRIRSSLFLIKLNKVVKNNFKFLISFISHIFSFIKNRIILIVIIIVFILSFILLTLNQTVNYEEINNILHSLITVTGIFSGIIISILSLKLFQIKEKKETLFKEFYELSRKMMFFRRICFELKSSIRFWKTFEDINWFENKFKDITFNKIHSPSNLIEKEISYEFWMSDKLEISSSKADLFLSFKQIINDASGIPYWLSDNKFVRKNSVDYLNDALMPSNQIWYYLDYKYKKHIEGEISFEDLSFYEVNQLQQHISELDPQYKNKEINRKLIAEIGSEFYENYIPRLIELTKVLGITFPKPLVWLFASMLVLVVTGVIAPLIILFFIFNIKTLIIATTILIFTYTFGTIIFFSIFFNFIKTELKYI